MKPFNDREQNDREHNDREHNDRGEDPDLPPAGVWLLVRATLADTGARPLPATTPSYLSPAILLGAPALAGVPVEVSALAQNRGLTPALGVTARFWWGDPSLGFVGAALQEIGHSDPINILAQNGEILTCTVPWTPEFVNGGHECLFVEVTCTADPVTQPFRPDLDRHMAQRNVQVTQTTTAMALTLHNPFRTEVLTVVGARTNRFYGLDLEQVLKVDPTLDPATFVTQLLDPRTVRLLRSQGLLRNVKTQALPFAEFGELGGIELIGAGKPSEDDDREYPPDGDNEAWSEYVVTEAVMPEGGIAVMKATIKALPPSGAVDVHEFVQLVGGAIIGGYAVVALPE